MNKINMLAVAGLMFFSAHNAFTMGKQEREILYALKKLGQDPAEVPMVTQNIDMFMGAFAMNIQINEADLVTANQKLKTALWKNAALFGGCIVSRQALNHVLTYFLGHTREYFSAYFILTQGVSGLGSAIGITWPVLNIHDAWKTRSVLVEALALDKEILAQLQEIKDSMDQDSETAGNFLLKSAE